MSCRFAELRLYDQTGTTPLGVLPVSGLKWSDEVGGGGSVSFSARVDSLPSPDALDDCVVKVAVPLVDGAAPTEIAQPFAVRGNDRVLTGTPVVEARGESAFRVWASDAVVRPEFAGDKMPRSAGEQRGLSWVSSAYDPATDASESWSLLSVSSRTERPTEPAWPTGTGADWITATTAANGDRKLFRSWLTVASDNTLIRAYFSSDETATLWVGGEELIQTDDTETGRKYTRTADRVFMAGTYAVAIDTATHVTKGGDGVDPVILAIAELDDDGDPSSWLLVTGASGWVATRRQITGPGSDPPGPTPGALVEMLAGEAAARGVSTWSGLTLDFDGDTDSDGVAWSTTEERIARYGFDSYLSLFDGLGDVACDMRVTPAGVLQARVFEGEDRSADVVLRVGAGARELRESLSPVVGTVVDAYTVDGWLTVKADPLAVGRRELALSLGSAPTLSQGERVASRALAELSDTRRDGVVSFVAHPGAVPYLDFWPGDTVSVDDGSGSVFTRRVLSLAGEGSSPVSWVAELGEPNL